MVGGRGRRGMALVLALVLIALGLAVGAAIAGNLMRASTLLRRQVATVHFDALLDAGMATALSEIARGGSWPGTSLRLGPGEVHVAVTSAGGTNYRVDLEAVFRGRRRQVTASVAAPPGMAPEVNGWENVTGAPLTRPPER